MIAALPPVFAGIPRDAADEAVRHLQTVEVQPGEPLMIEGETDTTLAFIVSGAVEHHRGRTLAGTAGAREMIGELEVFTRCPRVHSVTATHPVTLYALAAEGMSLLCEQGNPVVFAMERAVLRRVGDRARLLDAAIAERSSGEPFYLRPPVVGWRDRLRNRWRPPEEVVVDPLEALKRSPLFHWADEETLSVLASQCTPFQIGPEAPIHRQGEDAETMTLLASGQVELVVLVDTSRAETLQHVPVGHVFGDNPIALGTPRTSTAVSRSEVHGLQFDRRTFLHLFQSDDAVGSVFRQGMIRNAVLNYLATLERYVTVTERWQVGHPALQEDTSPGGGRWRD